MNAKPRRKKAVDSRDINGFLPHNTLVNLYGYQSDDSCAVRSIRKRTSSASVFACRSTAGLTTFALSGNPALATRDYCLNQLQGIVIL